MSPVSSSSTAGRSALPSLGSLVSVAAMQALAGETHSETQLRHLLYDDDLFQRCSNGEASESLSGSTAMPELSETADAFSLAPSNLDESAPILEHNRTATAIAEEQYNACAFYVANKDWGMRKEITRLVYQKFRQWFATSGTHEDCPVLGISANSGLSEIVDRRSGTRLFSQEEGFLAMWLAFAKLKRNQADFLEREEEMYWVLQGRTKIVSSNSRYRRVQMVAKPDWRKA